MSGFDNGAYAEDELHESGTDVTGTTDSTTTGNDAQRMAYDVDHEEDDDRR